MLLALLLPDPCDPLCPGDFKMKARQLLPEASITIPGKTDKDLQKAILDFIANFANWDNSSNPRFLKVGRGLVKAAHPEETPLVVDPFAGGGSIPLEALRLGCDAFASDLNPVACLILKVILEDIPRHGSELAEEVRSVGAKIKKLAEKELVEFYPPESDGSKPTAYLWARTVKCETPNCGAEIPLAKSFWLSKKASRKVALKYAISRPKGQPPRLVFEIFTPNSEKEVPTGTVSRAKAACPCCNVVLQPERVRAQLKAQHGGTDVILDSQGNRIGGAYLLSVISRKDNGDLKHRLSTDNDYQTILKVMKRLKKLKGEKLPNGLSPIPDESLKRVPVTFGVINVWVYGMETWGNLFSARQAFTLAVLSRLIDTYTKDCDKSVRDLLFFALSVFARSCNGNARIRPDSSVAPAFGMQALPFTWAYPETVPWGTRAENFTGAIDSIASIIEDGFSSFQEPGQVQQGDARKSILPHGSCSVWFTDPPYYDAIPYSYLSDFFYVWLKRALFNDYPNFFSTTLTPKNDEIVCYQSEIAGNENPRSRFERMLSEAFLAGRRTLKNDGIGSIVFAHKTTEGWEALLSGINTSGWTITASWPIATEAANRLRAREASALATSVHLVCRPRSKDASVGDWAEVLRELPKRVGDWMERLESEGIHGADLVFACIGPALEIFSRYSRVETAEGREVTLAEYLEKVWEVVGRTALQQVLGTAEPKARNSAAGALEEDARLTALFLWTLKDTQSPNGKTQAAGDSSEDEEESVDAEDEESPSKKKPAGFTLIYDVVRRFAQPLGIHLEDWEDRIISTEKGLVRLIPVKERAKQLFGEDGATAFAERVEIETKDRGQKKFDFSLELTSAPAIKGPSRRSARKGQAVSEDQLATHKGATTLDRVHAAMLFQSGGRTNALRALIKQEQDRGPDFMRLANALAALYPKGTEEKRLLEAMLQAAPR
jgi:adenine-specific DNA methylase